MEIEATEVTKVNAKVLNLCLKVSNRFMATLISETGTELKDYEGYVPDFMPGDHYGDYVELEIDIDTGKITNWEVPTAAQIKAFMADESD